MVLREFRKRFRRNRPAFFKSDQWYFHQDNALVHNSILVTDYLTNMSMKTVPQPPYSSDLGPCDFWLFAKLKEKSSLSLWDYWEDKSGSDEGLWYAHTRGLTKGLPEVDGTAEQVHRSRRRLLWRGLEFHVCTIDKSAHTKKIWKLIVYSLIIRICMVTWCQEYLLRLMALRNDKEAQRNPGY